MGRPIEDMTGRRVGALRVTGQAGSDKGRRMMWTCLCECGRSCVVRGDHLRREVVRSCGQCAAYHPQELTSANAKYLIRTYESPGRWSGRKMRFGAAFERETGKLACDPRIPTFIFDAFASALSGLAHAGLIRGKEGRHTTYRWAQEERCVLEQAITCESAQEMNALWVSLTGKPLNNDSPEKLARKAAEAAALPKPEPSPPAVVDLMAEWNRED